MSMTATTLLPDGGPLTSSNYHQKPELISKTTDVTSSITLRKATLADASTIAEIGGRTFVQTFGFSIPEADLKTYLFETYTAEAITREISSSDKHFIVACANDQHGRSSIVGFFQLTENTTEPCVSHISQMIELQRLYVRDSCQGLGIGRALLLETERLAKSLGFRSIWLGVWEGNFAAQRVYEKFGYSRLGEHEFWMGKCVQIDWILWKEI